MTTPMIECVPNISEGVNRQLINNIASVIPADDVYLLDVNTDPDHNRSVFTFAGTPDAVENAMLRIAEIAIDAIDLETHVGVHPRIGAVDVIPFIPIRGISLTECAERARAFGRRFAQNFNIPVYLYEAAALRPERTNLAHIRRGGYELLKSAIGTDPSRQPDFGPHVLTRAGASVIGARKPLIAFNAYLDTNDVTIAQQIAERLRESGGGLPFVKAIGVRVGGHAQVSMNVIDFRLTSLYTIMRLLESLANTHQVSITNTELVGLIPQAALISTAIEALRLPLNTVSATLEYRLGEKTGDYREVTFE